MGRAFRELFQTVVLAVLLFIGLQATTQSYTVEGASMEPQLQPDDRIWVNKLTYLRIEAWRLERVFPFLDIQQEHLYPFHPPLRGEVIVLKNPLDPTRRCETLAVSNPLDPMRCLVKRVIALSGETVAVHDGSVFINGQRLEEPYLTESTPFRFGPLLVPPDHYFVMGDNRARSYDSRDFGPVPISFIIGKAWLSYWPLTFVPHGGKSSLTAPTQQP